MLPGMTFLIAEIFVQSSLPIERLRMQLSCYRKTQEFPMTPATYVFAYGKFSLNGLGFWQVYFVFYHGYVIVVCILGLFSRYAKKDKANTCR